MGEGWGGIGMRGGKCFGGYSALLTALNGRPRVQVKGSVVDYLVLPLPFPLSVPLPSVRGKSGGLTSGVSVCLCLFLCPFPCPFLCPWEGLQLGLGSRRRNQRARNQEGLGGCGYVIPPGGEVVHLKRERAWSPKGLAQAGDRREEGGHPEMGVGIDSFCNSRQFPL